MGMNYEQEYNRVMGLLRNTKMPHGLCEPRERKACTHCNAVEELDKLIAEYKGARIVLAGATTTTSKQPARNVTIYFPEVPTQGDNEAEIRSS